MAGRVSVITFVVTPTTKVVLHKDTTATNVGIVKIRAPKNSTAAALPTFTAFQVIYQGTKS